MLSGASGNAKLASENVPNNFQQSKVNQNESSKKKVKKTPTWNSNARHLFFLVVVVSIRAFGVELPKHAKVGERSRVGAAANHTNQLLAIEQLLASSVDLSFLEATNKKTSSPVLSIGLARASRALRAMCRSRRSARETTQSRADREIGAPCLRAARCRTRAALQTLALRFAPTAQLRPRKREQKLSKNT